MVKPTKLHWKATKQVLIYLRGVLDFGLWYRRSDGVNIQGFIDLDWVGSPSYRKRKFRAIFSVGLASVSWYSRKQRSIALGLEES